MIHTTMATAALLQIGALLCMTLPSTVWAQGYTVTQITSGSDTHFDPAVSTSGELVFSAPDDNGVLQIFSETRGQLSFGPTNKRFPEVNGVGDVVWLDGNITMSLPHDAEAGAAVEVGTPGQKQFKGDINDAGEIVWVQFDEGIGFRVYSNQAGGTVLIDTDASPAPPIQGVAINNNGELIWRPGVGPGSTADIGLFSTTRGFLVEEEDDHFDPSLNDSGELVWYQHDEFGVWQIFHSELGQLTTGPQNKRWPEITNSGEIYWTGEVPGGRFQLFHAVPDATATLPIDPFAEFNAANKDTDGDGVPDRFDVFADDPTHFADTDQDGVADDEDPDRPLFTSFVADLFDRSIAESDLTDASSSAQQGLIGARVVVRERDETNAFVLTAQLGDTSQYSPGKRLSTPLGERVILGWPIALGPDGTQLSGTSTLTLPYDRSLLSKVLFGSVIVARIDGDGTVRVLSPVQADSFGIVTVSPGHFSQFVVVGQSISTDGGGGCVAARGGQDRGGFAAPLLLVAPLAVASWARRRVARS